MSNHSHLDTLVTLCREFGGERYVRGGGGNASCKDAQTLWVKPSGTTLVDIRADQFVAVDRAGIQKLYAAAVPEDWQAREAVVKRISTDAVLPGSRGRPSVETPLHDTFPQTYVMHTHPASVNGMTCARDGAEACRRLFPEALWVPYTDPGYTVCMVVREAMLEYQARRRRPPSLVVLQNHGLFVAADAPEEIRALMRTVMDKIDAEIGGAGIPRELPVGPEPDIDRIGAIFDILQGVIDDGSAACIVPSGPAATPKGPVTPDHIVYAKSYVYDGMPTAEGLRAYHQARGYWPRVVSTPGGVYGVGPTQKTAALALEFALDGALVEQYARAFGGIVYLDRRSMDFIENWEVESYRRKVAGQ